MGFDGTKDYYARLEVARGASRDDIVGAYRRLARGAHPDAHPEDRSAAGRFREITEAYEVLGDPKSRAAYDRQLGGAQIQVRIRATSGGDSSEARPAPWRHHEGIPVFSSTSRPRRSDVPPGVWPLWPRSIDGRSAGAISGDRWVSGVADLFEWIFAPWWHS